LAPGIKAQVVPFVGGLAVEVLVVGLLMSLRVVLVVECSGGSRTTPGMTIGALRGNGPPVVPLTLALILVDSVFQVDGVVEAVVLVSTVVFIIDASLFLLSCVFLALWLIISFAFRLVGMVVRAASCPRRIVVLLSIADSLAIVFIVSVSSSSSSGASMGIMLSSSLGVGVLLISANDCAAASVAWFLLLTSCCRAVVCVLLMPLECRCSLTFFFWWYMLW